MHALSSAAAFTQLGSRNPPQKRLSSFGVLLDVTLVVNLRTLRKQALTALLTAAAKCVSSCLRAHAGTETVLTLADSLGWLISTFHGKNVVRWVKTLDGLLICRLHP